MEGQNRIFIGGIPVRVEKKTIVDFFGQYGKIRHCKIKKNTKTGRSLGYAYITFEDVQSTKKLLNTQIEFYGRICECKPVFKKEDLKDEIAREKRRKLLVYDLDLGTTNAELKEVFESITNISHAYVVKNPDSTSNVGYGYVVFHSESELDSFYQRGLSLIIHGRSVKVSAELQVPPKKKVMAPKREESTEGNELPNDEGSHPSVSHNNRFQEESECISQLQSQSRLNMGDVLVLEPRGISGSHSNSKVENRENKPTTKMSAIGTPIVCLNTVISEKNQRINVAGQAKVPNRVTQGFYAAGYNHLPYNKVHDKDRTGWTDTTKQSNNTPQLPHSSSVQNTTKKIQTGIMRDILRTSMYISHELSNFRFNRCAGLALA